MKDTKYPLRDAEAKKNAHNWLNYLLYVVLGAVILITGAHAVMLVLSQASSYALAGQDGLVGSFLTLIRVAFPLMVEVAAIVAGVGFIQARWRDSQKSAGMAIEAVWFLFAAANMITFFAVERGQELQGWQSAWIQYGLPLSALVAGVLTYALLRVDPDHKRADEEALAMEKKRANEFNATNAVETSDAMALIQQRRVWRDTINNLAAQGYTQDEIDFITAYIPELQNVPTAAPIADDKPPSWVAGLLGRIGINTHPDNPAVLPLMQPATGQGDKGNGPAGRKVDADGAPPGNFSPRP